MYKVTAPYPLIAIMYRWFLIRTNEPFSCSMPSMASGLWYIEMTGCKPEIQAEFFFIFGSRLIRDSWVIMDEMGKTINIKPLNEN